MGATVRHEEQVGDHTFVQRFLADMNDMGTPRCFRTDNGGEFTSRSYTDFAVSTQHQGSHSKMRWSRAPYGAQ